jgi:hypothetical protein
MLNSYKIRNGRYFLFVGAIFSILNLIPSVYSSDRNEIKSVKDTYKFDSKAVDLTKAKEIASNLAYQQQILGKSARDYMAKVKMPGTHSLKNRNKLEKKINEGEDVERNKGLLAHVSAFNSDSKDDFGNIVDELVTNPTSYDIQLDSGVIKLIFVKDFKPNFISNQKYIGIAQNDISTNRVGACFSLKDVTGMSSIANGRFLSIFPVGNDEQFRCDLAEEVISEEKV